MALALIKSHHPDANIPAISAGFTGDGTAASKAIANNLLELCRPYSAHVERVVLLDEFLDSSGPPEDQNNKDLQVDFKSTNIFADVRGERLFNFRPKLRFIENDSDEDSSDAGVESSTGEPSAGAATK